MLFPRVSGKFQEARQVDTLMARIAVPIVRNGVVLDTKYEQTAPLTRATAFAALCPVVLISVVRISAVDTHVAQLALMKNMRARNAASISWPR